MSPTVTALIGFATWFVFLSIGLGIYRVALVLGGSKAANSFTPSGSELAPFGARLTRARDNCFETLPLFAALTIGADLSGQLAVTDPLALWLLAFRIGQSLVHLASTSVLAVQIRASLFFAQMLIYAWWAIQLLG